MNNETLKEVLLSLASTAAVLAGAVLVVLASFSAIHAYADDSVTRNHSFDLDGISVVEIRGSVGRMNISPVSGNELSVALIIEGQDEGWFRSARDVSGLDLAASVHGDRLVLEMEEKDTRTTWTINLPAVGMTRVGLGVGEVNIEVGEGALEVNLGVGDIDVQAPVRSIGPVSLFAGVGDTRLSGAMGEDNRRYIVASESNGRGEGEGRLNAEVGVGDVAVWLR